MAIKIFIICTYKKTCQMNRPARNEPGGVT